MAPSSQALEPPEKPGRFTGPLGNELEGAGMAFREVSVIEMVQMLRCGSAGTGTGRSRGCVEELGFGKRRVTVRVFDGIRMPYATRSRPGPAPVLACCGNSSAHLFAPPPLASTG